MAAPARRSQPSEFLPLAFGIANSPSLTVQTPPLADLSMTEWPPPPPLLAAAVAAAPAAADPLELPPPLPPFCCLLELFLERKKEARLELLLSELSVRRNRFWNIWKKSSNNSY